MKDKKIAVTILLMVLMLLPLAAVGSEKSKAKVEGKGGANKSKVASATPTATPGWDLSKPASCSVEGPPPCPKCTVTCQSGKRPTCVPGDSSANACVKPSSCFCK